MKTLVLKITAPICLLLLTASCETELLDTNNLSADAKVAVAAKHASPGPYTFNGAVYDISAAPDGSIMVGVNGAEGRTLEVIKNGQVSTMATVNTSTDIQGVASIGSGNAFVTSAGSDLALDGALYKVSNGTYRMVADLAAFERNNDPDAFFGIQWKDQLCEAIDGFSAGPQNNPYKVASSGNTAYIADAAGNTVLSSSNKGDIDWLAILTPPIDDNGEFLIRWNAGEEGEIDCYAQPVPTSVAIDTDDNIYIGELTGALGPQDGVFPIGKSRIWKIKSGENNVVLDQRTSSQDYELLIDGLTSVIDIEIGPDGMLYVVELDENSWMSLLGIPGLTPIGGTISRYHLDGTFDAAITGLSLPGAITFDKNGQAWVLENLSSVRMLDFDVEAL
ncbi:ScyD/ScyE family protein [Winogradskyella ouciana]|uniref:ScyD/ScyE family protein n=1 Tax=Winogradskyella ouciana TaxID=2608631 RepID=A0A7K1GCD7_9FLAO|nr:ScyD/ScyE family protein [Winogradskyella ouciana]MTE26068.1 ScyD/ScyE family protein [Winogradskyella ouciana]